MSDITNPVGQPMSWMDATLTPGTHDYPFRVNEHQDIETLVAAYQRNDANVNRATRSSLINAAIMNEAATIANDHQTRTGWVDDNFSRSLTAALAGDDRHSQELATNGHDATVANQTAFNDERMTLAAALVAVRADRGVKLEPTTCDAITALDKDGFLSDQLKIDVASYYGTHQRAADRIPADRARPAVAPGGVNQSVGITGRPGHTNWGATPAPSHFVPAADVYDVDDVDQVVAAQLANHAGLSRESVSELVDMSIRRCATSARNNHDFDRGVAQEMRRNLGVHEAWDDTTMADSTTTALRQQESRQSLAYDQARIPIAQALARTRESRAVMLTPTTCAAIVSLDDDGFLSDQLELNVQQVYGATTAAPAATPRLETPSRAVVKEGRGGPSGHQPVMQSKIPASQQTGWVEPETVSDTQVSPQR